MYRSNELVNCRLPGGARPAEPAVQGNERTAGARDAARTLREMADLRGMASRPREARVGG